MFTITATAPTVYQLNSLRSFKMKVTENANGSFTASQDFETERDAKDYLIKLAEDFYFEDGKEITSNHIENIKKYGSLRLDAVSASIEEKEQWKTQDSETGIMIDTFNSFAEAAAALKSYEITDKAEGNYTPDFYEIVPNK